MSECPYLLNSHLVTLSQQSSLGKIYPRSTQSKLKSEGAELSAVEVQES